MIKVSSNYPKLFQKIQKHADYINYLMEDQTFSQFFLEIVSDGLIYVYHDFDTYQMVNRPYREFQVKKFQKRFKETLEPDVFLTGNLNAKTFPAEGIILRFKTQCARKHDVIEIGKRHFQSLLGDSIEICHDDQGDLQVRFKTFTALANYTFLLSSMLSGLIKAKETATKPGPKPPAEKPLEIE